MHELERRLGVVVQPAHHPRVRPRRPRPGRRGAAGRPRGAPARPAQRWSTSSGASASCARTSGRLSSSTRSGLISARAPGGLVEVEPGEELRSSAPVRRAAVGVAERGQLAAGSRAGPARGSPRRPRRSPRRPAPGRPRRSPRCRPAAAAGSARPAAARSGRTAPAYQQLDRQRAARCSPCSIDRPHHAGRALGAQRHRPVAAVGEGVHLLADDVGRLADPAGEQPGVLEDRQLDQPVPGPVARRRSASRARARSRADSGGQYSGSPLGAANDARPLVRRGLGGHRPRPGAGARIRRLSLAGTGWPPARGRSSWSGRGRAGRARRRRGVSSLSRSAAQHRRACRRRAGPCGRSSPRTACRRPGCTSSPCVGGRAEHHRPRGVPGRVVDPQREPGQLQRRPVVERAHLAGLAELQPAAEERGSRRPRASRPFIGSASMLRSSGWMNAGTSCPSHTGATENVWSKCPWVSSTATGVSRCSAQHVAPGVRRRPDRGRRPRTPARRRARGRSSWSRTPLRGNRRRAPRA